MDDATEGPAPAGAAPDDASLVAQARTGDAAAFAALFDRHVTAVFWQAYQVVRDRDEAQDVTQDTFVTAWRRLADLTVVDRSVLPWLLVTARYTALNAHRKRARLRAVPLDHDPATDAPGPESEVDAAEVAAAIEAALETLSPTDRRLFDLCVDGDLTYDQAAAELGVTHAAVRNRVSRLRTRLRGHLREEER